MIKKAAIALFAIVMFIVFVVVIIMQEDDQCTAQAGTSATSVNADGLAYPTDKAATQVTSGYEPRWGTFHWGVDLAGPVGTPIYAFADGTVVASGAASGFGHWIVLAHTFNGQQYQTTYGHMFANQLMVQAGQQVKAGQQIASIGNDGESTGAHLHFEIAHGDRNVPGNRENPQPWLDRASSAGSGGLSGGAAPTVPVPALPANMQDLPPSPRFAEAHMQRDSVRLGRTIAAVFPQIQTIGGWRPKDHFPDHPSGRAVDVMIPNYDSPEGIALGNAVLGFVKANKDEFHVKYTIWRQTSWDADSGHEELMDDRFSPTQNHFDHVHITVKEGSGFPGADEHYAFNGTLTSASGSGCLGGDHSDLGNTDGIPAELVPWIQKAGSLCPEVDAPLIAAVMETESHFSPTANSGKAYGYAQFTDATWAAKGRKVDANGNPVGPPGSGSRSDPADATMAMGRYLCEIAEGQRGKPWKGDPMDWMLAGYNAGPGAAAKAEGYPKIDETIKYQKNVKERRQKYMRKV